MRLEKVGELGPVFTMVLILFSSSFFVNGIIKFLVEGWI
jgi:hypothetical protein